MYDGSDWGNREVTIACMQKKANELWIDVHTRSNVSCFDLHIPFGFGEEYS